MALTTTLLAVTGAGLTTTSAAATATAVAAGDVGYVGPSYGDPALGTGTNAPTAEKPESKLWFAYGQWWGALYNKAANDFHVYGYDAAGHVWNDTGSVIETRQKVWMDVLWDGSHLFVVSTGAGKVATNLQISRFTFNPTARTWPRDVAPTPVANGWLYSPVIERDSKGVLWVTYTVNDSVMVTHSTASDGSAWVTPYVLPTPNQESTVSYDPVKDPKQPSGDISSVVAFDGDKVGILWSNQRTDKVYWASHTDGTSDQKWTLDTAYSHVKGADDHLNVKSIVGDPSGRVFAVAKTSSTTSDQALINVLVLDRNGDWSAHEYASYADQATRAILMIDSENRELYVFASSPCCTGGNIYYKKTSMDSVSFAPGLGTPFIVSSTNTHVNNPTSTKQNVNHTTGLLVLAGDDVTDNYLFNQLALRDSTPPDTSITSKPAASSTVSTATFGFSSTEAGSTFRCSLDGAAPQVCSTPKAYTGLANGSHSFSVRAVDPAGNVDATPATYSWTVAVPVTPPAADTTAPDTALTATPPAVSTSRSATFAFSSSEAGSTFRCSLDGAAAAACGSTLTYHGLRKGTHSFTVYAVDAAGNADATPARYAWSVTPWFADTFSSGSFSAGGWSVRRAGTGKVVVVRGAVTRGNPGARLRSDTRPRSTASIGKVFPGVSNTLGVTWDGRTATTGVRGQYVDVLSLRNSAGHRVLSVERISSSGRLRVRDALGVTGTVRGPSVGQRARFVLDVTVNAAAKDAWSLSMNGRVLWQRSAAELGGQGLRSLRFGTANRRRSLDYRVDNVEVWQ